MHILSGLGPNYESSLAVTEKFTRHVALALSVLALIARTIAYFALYLAEIAVFVLLTEDAHPKGFEFSLVVAAGPYAPLAILGAIVAALPPLSRRPLLHSALLLIYALVTVLLLVQHWALELAFGWLWLGYGIGLIAFIAIRQVLIAQYNRRHRSAT